MGRDSLASFSTVDPSLPLTAIIDSLGDDFFVDDSFEQTPLNRLVLNSDLRSKVMQLKNLYFIQDLGRFSAEHLVAKLSLTREELLELLLELDTHSVHIYINGDWDKNHFKIRRDLPQYYTHRHAPGRNIESVRNFVYGRISPLL